MNSSEKNISHGSDLTFGCWSHPGYRMTDRGLPEQVFAHSIKFREDRKDGVSVLRCSGRIVFGPESEDFFLAVREHFRRNASLILDFCEVEIVDCRGLGTLLTLHAFARSRAGAISLINVHAKIRSLIQVMNLFDLFQPFESESEALRASRPCHRAVLQGESNAPK